MALKLVINLSKKVPGPEEYSSIQASCSIEGELAAGQDPVAEAARLYAQAEAAVDRQLGIAPAPPAAPQPTTANTPPARTAASVPSRTGRPAPRGRRAPPISASQLGLIHRLLERTGANLPGILAQYQVGRLEDLDVPSGSRLIDELKAIEAGAR